jgi:hypothetical protein
MLIENYNHQVSHWPNSGHVILAQHDDASIVVYQAYKQSIGHYAAKHGKFGGDFSFSRMTWIKPNFLWMMYRSGWGLKPNQEVTLAIRIRRDAFDEILSRAVPSSFDTDLYPTREVWQEQVKVSDVRLQWDPDHDPLGAKQARRAIQLGLRGQIVQHFSNEWVISITDISNFVEEQRKYLASNSLDLLRTPKETVYRPVSSSLCKKLRLNPQGGK